MMNSWKCTECRNLVYPNYCSRKEIKVDRNFDGPCDLAEPLTNGDRIRAMSNWDLAEFIAQNSSCRSCVLFARCDDEECDETWWSWLDSLADNEEMHSCSECNNRDNSCNRSITQSPFFKDLMAFIEKEFGREAARQMELFALTWHGRNNPAESEGI